MHGLRRRVRGHRTVSLALIIFFSAALQAIASDEKSELPAEGEITPVVGRNVVDDLRIQAIPGAPKVEAPDSLNDIINIAPGGRSEKIDAETAARLNMVSSAGFEIGLAKGYSARIQKDLDRIRKIEPLLNQIFSFRDLFLIANHDAPVEQALHLQPPIISRLEDVIQIEQEGKYLRTIDGVYRIIDSERFVANPPRWQEYIMSAAYDYEKSIANVVLPRNSAERSAWKEAVASGWQQGQYQAAEEIEARVAKLKRDFYGMLDFVELKLTRQITDGYVAYQYAGVDGGQDEMNINSRTYRITNRTALNPIADQWRGALSSRLQPSYESAGVRVFKDVQNCSMGDASECP